MNIVMLNQLGNDIILLRSSATHMHWLNWIVIESNNGMLLVKHQAIILNNYGLQSM